MAIEEPPQRSLLRLNPHASFTLIARNFPAVGFWLSSRLDSEGLSLGTMIAHTMVVLVSQVVTAVTSTRDIGHGEVAGAALDCGVI